MGSEIVFLFSFPSHFLYFAMLFLLKQNEKAQKIEQEKEKKESQYKQYVAMNEKPCLA